MSDQGAVGIIGVGHMGLPMARNIVAAGFTVLGYDTDPHREFPPGVTRRDSVAAVVGEARTIVLSLPNAAAVDVVVDEICGAADGRLVAVADTSTIGTTAAVAAAARLAEHGVDYADATVSGGVAGAEHRSISLMFAGSDAAFRMLGPVLDALSSKVFRVGARPGLAQALKVANNFLAATALVAASEAIGFLVAAGLDPGVALTVINASSGATRATEDKFVNHVLTGRYASGFANTLMAKDVRLYLEAVTASGTAAQVGHLVSDIWDEFAARTPDVDFTRIYMHVNASVR